MAMITMLQYDNCYNLGFLNSRHFLLLTHKGENQSLLYWILSTNLICLQFSVENS